VWCNLCSFILWCSQASPLPTTHRTKGTRKKVKTSELVSCCLGFSQHRELLQSEGSTQIVWRLLKNLLLIRTLSKYKMNFI
jgi:hypothetical protein